MVSGVENSLKLRGYLQRWLLPRRRSDFFTDSQLKTYPRGYQLKELGLTWMLDKLEGNCRESRLALKDYQSIFSLVFKYKLHTDNVKMMTLL